MDEFEKYKDKIDLIKEKIECAYADMDSHSYNGYTDDSEYTMFLTVAELKCLYMVLGGDISDWFI